MEKMVHAPFLPALVFRGNFTKVELDQETTALAESVSPEDTQKWMSLEQQSYMELIQHRQWRLVAIKCEKDIMAGNPESTQRILKLWCLRFKALLRARLIEQANRETETIYRIVLAGIMRDGPEADRFPWWVPFELEVLRAGNASFSGDGERAGNRLSRLARACQRELSRSTNDRERQMWKSRIQRLSVLIASTLRQIGGSIATERVIEDALGNAVEEQQEAAQIELECILSALHFLNGEKLSTPAQSSKISGALKEELNAFQNYHLGKYTESVNEFRNVGDKFNLQSENKMELGNAYDQWKHNNLAGTFMNNSCIGMVYELLIDQSMDQFRKAIATMGTSTAQVFNYATISDLRLENSIEEKRNLVSRVLKSGALDGFTCATFKIGPV